MVGDVGVFADRDVVDDGGDMVMVMWLTALVMLVTVMRLMTMVIRMTLM